MLGLCCSAMAAYYQCWPKFKQARIKTHWVATREQKACSPCSGQRRFRTFIHQECRTQSSLAAVASFQPHIAALRQWHRDSYRKWRGVEERRECTWRRTGRLKPSLLPKALWALQSSPKIEPQSASMRQSLLETCRGTAGAAVCSTGSHLRIC